MGSSISPSVLLVVGLALCAPALVGCTAPPPAGEGAAQRDGATPAPASVPAEITVVFQPAQLCPSPEACLQGDELVWVPAGTALAVVEVRVQELPRSDVYWFRVEYEGRAGWVSEFATDKAPRVRGGDIVRE